MSSRDQCIAALAVAGLSIQGNTTQLRKRLLEHMMSTSSSSSPAPSPISVPTSPTYVPTKKVKKDVKKPLKKPPTQYNLFVKEMVPVVTKEGYRGKEMLKRISQLWALKKNEKQPFLLLTDKSSSDDIAVEQLVDSLSVLDPTQLRANLSTFHLSTSGTKEEMVERLALAMLS